ncbi:MAG: radical SAM protein, partial [Candidatus Thorarchaeota archaeon]
MDAEGLLRLKIRLLTEGATLPESEYSGRKGGAGPSGARYYLLENSRPCGVPIRHGLLAERYGSARLQPTDNPEVWLFDGTSELRLVPKPKFYDSKTNDGTPYYKIALLHGKDTLATTLYQSCRYWDTGHQCKFCTIPFSYTAGNTVLEKTPEQLIEVVRAAEQEGVIKNILITTGTPASDDAGSKAIVSVVRAIRK